MENYDVQTYAKSTGNFYMITNKNERLYLKKSRSQLIGNTEEVLEWKNDLDVFRSWFDQRKI